MSAATAQLAQSLPVESDDQKLTNVERDDFDQLDTAIRRHVSGFKQLGLFLDEVNRRRLYREEYGTWEAYVADVGLTANRAYELIEAATKAARVLEISNIEIKTESHAAALADVPDDECAAVLKIASETTGRKLTAKSIKQASKKRESNYVPLTDELCDKINGEMGYTAVVNSLDTLRTKIPADPARCEKSDDGNHNWDSDKDGRFCTLCHEDWDADFHGPDVAPVAKATNQNEYIRIEGALNHHLDQLRTLFAELATIAEGGALWGQFVEAIGNMEAGR